MPSSEFYIEKLPFWTGLVPEPGIKAYLPFGLRWNDLGFIQQSFSAETLQSILSVYSENSYSSPTAPPGLSTWANRLGSEYYDYIRTNLAPTTGKRGFEIGAGSLFLAEKLVHDDGVTEYVVVDPCISQSSRTPQIEIRREYFTSLGDDDFDFGISLNCLEHVPNPMEFLRGVFESLVGKKGKFILVFPDIEAQFLKGDFNALCHEHINYFSASSADHIIRSAGFRIVDRLKRFDTLYYTLEASGTPKALEPDQARDPLIDKAIAKFNENLERLSHEIPKKLKEQGTLAIHGATNGLNNLLTLIGLENNSDILIFDGDETKQGRFLPATRNPILHSSSPLYRQAKSVLVSSQTFYSEIADFLVANHHIDKSNIKPLFN